MPRRRVGMGCGVMMVPKFRQVKVNVWLLAGLLRETRESKPIQRNIEIVGGYIWATHNKALFSTKRRGDLQCKHTLGLPPAATPSTAHPAVPFPLAPWLGLDGNMIIILYVVRERRVVILGTHHASVRAHRDRAVPEGPNRPNHINV